MKIKKARSTQDIIASNIAKLSGEAPRVVPLDYTTLFKRVQERRLEAFGVPASVAVDHLQDQYRKGFPLLKTKENAA